MNCCGYNVSQILTGGENMSSDTYKQERDRHFDEWWESLSEAEKRFLGIHNARYCWLEGHKEGYRKGCEDTRDVMGEADANSR